MSTPSKLHSICFGGEDWWYHNRGHVDMQLTRRLARLGPALYVNSVVMQRMSITTSRSFMTKVKRKVASIMTGVRESGEGFWVYSPCSFPMHSTRAGRWINRSILAMQMSIVQRRLGLSTPLVLVHCPAACQMALQMERCRLVYLRTDRYEEFPNVDRDAIAGYDSELKANADLTIFANHQLFMAEGADCRKAIYLDHGVDYTHFATSSGETPPKLKGLRRPIVGFIGAIDAHTFDMELMEKVVRLLPQASFVFVGRASVDCGTLAGNVNVTMTGQQPYEAVPEYGHLFDVAIMPWRQNRWIEACNPIKLKEYLAMGKPIVSTPFPELCRYGDVVYLADDADGFAEAILKAAGEDSMDKVAARRDLVKDESWEARTSQMLGELFGESPIHYPDQAEACI
jgi:glycosyltransferase involved in cell wall biosynthesis